MQLKDNQFALHEKAQGIAATEQPIDVVTEKSRGHNRSEPRMAAVFDARNAVAGTKWEDLVSSIIQVTRTTHKRTFIVSASARTSATRKPACGTQRPASLSISLRNPL